MDDYELIDAGGGGRLERFGAHVVDRPHGGALADRRAPERWIEADLRFDRERGWSGPATTAPADAASRDWTIAIDGVRLELRPTDAGQVGAFPEHAAMLPWLRDQVRRRHDDAVTTEVLNLFAYTGLATLALAREGAAVAHVDASRPTVAWARRNAAANDLATHPIRWLVDDARTFVARERRRGRRYAGIVLDPPTYGHGIKGQTWRLEHDLEPLLHACADLLASDGFVLLTAHAEGIGPEDLAARLANALRRSTSDIDAGDLASTATSGAHLALGGFARWDGAA